MRRYTATIWLDDDAETTPEYDLESLQNGTLTLDDLVECAKYDDKAEIRYSIEDV